MLGSHTLAKGERWRISSGFYGMDVPLVLLSWGGVDKACRPGQFVLGQLLHFASGQRLRHVDAPDLGVGIRPAAHGLHGGDPQARMASITASCAAGCNEGKIGRHSTCAAAQVATGSLSAAAEGSCRYIGSEESSG